jgi:hypothetical protein
MIGMMRRSKDMGNVIDQQVGKDDTWGIDIDGVVGEYCVAKQLNVCPDLTVSPRKGGIDLKSRTGNSIDVKTTRHKSGRLLATVKKIEDPCDIYVLVIVDDNGGDVIGYATKEDLFDEKNIKDLGHGNTYALDQNELKELI